MTWRDAVLFGVQHRAPQIPKHVAAAILKAKYPNDEPRPVVERAIDEVIEAYLLDDVPAPRQTPCVIYSRPSLYGFASSGMPVAAVWSTVSEAIPASTNFPENFRYREVYGVDTLTRHPSG